MKDKEAQKDIKDIYTRLDSIEDSVRRYSDLPNILSIKDCPKCKHEVLAKEHKKVSLSGACLYTEFYQCLTCGSQFNCSEKQVCELIK